MTSAWTAAVFLAALAHAVPSQYKKEPHRIATIAVAAELAQTELLKRWPYASQELGGAFVTAIVFESAALRSVHAGTLRSRTGDLCLVQINRRNPAWRKYVTEFDELGGVDLESTMKCLLVGGESLIRAARYCRAKRYFTNWRRALWTAYATGSVCWGYRGAIPRSAHHQRMAWTKWQPTEEHIRFVNEVKPDDSI